MTAFTIDHGGRRLDAKLTTLSIHGLHALVGFIVDAEIVAQDAVTLHVATHVLPARIDTIRAESPGTAAWVRLELDAAQRQAFASLTRFGDMKDGEHLRVDGRSFERTVVPEAPVARSPNELLAEILASPEDDAPRLVYADWLIQRGDPRGEFITVQCELARRGEDATGDDIEALRAREAELLNKHKPKWIGDFAGTRTEYGSGQHAYAKGTPTKWHFERGFVHRVEMQIPDFVRNAPGLFAREPVRTFHPTAGSISQLLNECTELHRIHELDLEPWKFRGTDLRDLAADTHMTALEVLVMSKCKLGVKALIEFATHAVEKPALRELDLWWNAFGDKGALALASSPILRTLRVLDLSANKISAAAKAAIQASPHVKHIETLHI